MSLHMAGKFSYIAKHSPHVTTIIFVIGFVFDALMLPDISNPMTRYIGLFHLTVVATLLMFREWIVSRNTASSFEQKLYSFSSYGIALSLGAALSIVSVYALRSAELSVSWPMFVILFIIILVNEIVSSHSFRFTLDVGVLLLAALFYIIFTTPVLLGVQNDSTFLISIGASIVIFFVYLFFLRFTSESAMHETPRLYALSLGIPMFVGMLYFLNFIPAVPLSLSSSGVYHTIVNQGGEFIAEGETDTRKFLYFRTPIYHMSSLDTGVYFFSAVRSGGELTAPLSHVWEKYDEEKKQWISYDKPVSFTLEAGRKDGYRAYSMKQNIDEGLWRVSVKVDSKRIVGRYKFKVIRSTPPPLTEVKL